MIWACQEARARCSVGEPWARRWCWGARPGALGWLQGEGGAGPSGRRETPGHRCSSGGFLWFLNPSEEGGRLVPSLSHALPAAAAALVEGLGLPACLHVPLRAEEMSAGSPSRAAVPVGLGSGHSPSLARRLPCPLASCRTCVLRGAKCHGSRQGRFVSGQRQTAARLFAFRAFDLGCAS